MRILYQLNTPIQTFKNLNIQTPKLFSIMSMLNGICGWDSNNLPSQISEHFGFQIRDIQSVFLQLFYRFVCTSFGFFLMDNVLLRSLLFWWQIHYRVNLATLVYNSYIAAVHTNYLSQVNILKRENTKEVWVTNNKI